MVEARTAHFVRFFVEIAEIPCLFAYRHAAEATRWMTQNRMCVAVHPQRLWAACFERCGRLDSAFFICYI
ncbi:MAG: hypothetical protein A3I44_04025 [Candidatus Sungbacteria bacterium RIFCSPLOWO2_02_FULL_51_17]|uniref:Uncharacterized protein n=1 Tax=Candidatus Sungbacteria bacterium RIFCSPHIGHO2_02_FULL_51_29 TaxID=1802273 RepID=A0A1G2KS58_9BACT|nr:MAG: hypothetical protein A2676_02540 [Candidatus Sungbacteria bacterium RIFCSPHIGHO2_01_FULL_51_22]OHA02230.1 MAG: hypothetical protein A3C16_03990 [Candidatus Sungbacteria bacterium RIFCSPHIGHO2_02_FULL_51_29]OHA11253.1 MAG: hypothetical protein A3I44_04025 [Candidatus Sungbacteria bacterium RIFCSPLOWO2_02_FULL_51_17]